MAVMNQAKKAPGFVDFSFFAKETKVCGVTLLCGKNKYSVLARFEQT